MIAVEFRIRDVAFYNNTDPLSLSVVVVVPEGHSESQTACPVQKEGTSGETFELEPTLGTARHRDTLGLLGS